MSLPEISGIILGLLSIGASILTALISVLFLGLRSRIDKLEREVRADYNSCMDKIVDLTKEIAKR